MADNQLKYLQGLIQQGGGNAEWAKQQIKKLPTTTDILKNTVMGTTTVPKTETDTSKTTVPTTITDTSTQQVQTQNKQSGIIYDPQAKVWVDTATSKVVSGPSDTGIITNTTGVADNTAAITKSYEEQKTAALAALRAAIQKSKGQYQSTIASAPETFRPLKDQTTVVANQQLNRLRESMAEQGQAGGVSRSEELAVNTARENNLNALEQQQREVITQAQNAINDLESSGQLEEAKIVAENANNRIRALMEEANRVSAETYTRERTALEDQRYQDKLNQQTQQQQREDFAATINPQEDLTAKLNQLTAQGVPDTDYRVIELKKARTQKLANMAEQQYAAELSREKDETKRQEQAFETAKWKFEQGMPADSVTATLLGIPVGSVIPSQRIKEAQSQLDKIRASKSSSGGSGGSKPKADKPNITISDLEKGIERQFPEESTAEEESAIAARYIAEGIINGTISVEDAERLAIQYGVTENMIRSYTDQQKFNVMKNL